MSNRDRAPGEITPRFYGSETEYGYTRQDTPPRPFKKGKVSTLWADDYPHLDLFSVNGGCLYTDCGFPEYATPECSSLEELTTHETAGDTLTQEAIQKDYPELRLHKRSISPVNGASKRYTSGYHENHATDIDIWGHEPGKIYKQDVLCSHLGTRYIIIGAGTTYNTSYRISQKSGSIKNKIGNNPTAQKPLLSNRTEHHEGDPETLLKRLHIPSGDPNISLQALRLKFGSTSCVLRLLEHGVDASDVLLKDPVAAAHTTGGPIESANQLLQLQNGQQATALDIQERLAYKTQELSMYVPLPKEELYVLDIWLDVIDALRRYFGSNDVTGSLQQLDWFTKYELIEGSEKNPEVIDLKYDQVQEGIGYKLRSNEYRYAKHAVSETAHEAAKNTPPQSRALLRGGLVFAAYKYAQVHGKVADTRADWANFKSRGDVHLLGAVSRTYEPDEIEEISRKLELKP